MRKPSTLIAVIVVFIAGIGAGVIGSWLILHGGTELRYFILDSPPGKQPTVQVDAFAKALVRADREIALKLWEVEAGDAQGGLVSRRDRVTSDMAAAGLGADYMILNVQWWTTCCEPSVTCESRNAGGARILVQFLDRKERPLLYVFDVFAREQPYWGSAAGYPKRDWVIRDVYPQGEVPLFWTLMYEP